MPGREKIYVAPLLVACLFPDGTIDIKLDRGSILCDVGAGVMRHGIETFELTKSHKAYKKRNQ